MAQEDKGNEYRSVWNYLAEVSFKQDFVTVDTLSTRYVEAGRPGAPVLMLLHGTGGHWEAFCANIGPLAEHFHVYAIDMLGCGFTDKPDKPYEVKDYAAHAIAFMDKMGVEKAGFLGVSLGSWVSTRIAIDHPERVERMILIATTGYLPLPASINSAVDVRRDTARAPTWESTRKILSNLLYDPEKTLIDDLISIRKRVYSHPDIEKQMPRMLTLFDPEIRPRNNITEAEWRSIKLPTLIIENVDHEDIFLQTARAVAPLLENGKLLPMHEVSHWAQFEKPDEFNPIAIDFFSGKEV